MRGLVWWNVNQSEERLRGKADVNLKRTMIKAETKNMERFLGKISIDKSQWDKPVESGRGTDLDLSNPYSGVTCWVLYLYSMELGSPPLYMELNRACRQMDLTKLPQLGPFAYALSCVCRWGDSKKKKADKILHGSTIWKGLTGCFLLWRGASMKQVWIQPYLDNVGKVVHPAGSNSYSRNLTVALGYSFKDQAQDKIPVLFLLLH